MMRALAFVAFLAACGGDPPRTALFALPGDTTDFYALPFPNDLRREADGTIDLSAFPTNSLIADKYRAAADSLEGFGLNQAVFFRFDGTLGDPSLPDPAGSITETASVYLVDIDPDSPARGERSPILVRFRAEATQTLGENHLVARPYPGFGLAEGTTYAVVVTNRVGGVKAAPAFEALIGSGGDAKTIEARAVYQPLLDYLDEPGGDERGDVVSAAVFTTQHATQIVPALRNGVLAAPAPTASDIVVSPMSTPDVTVFVAALEGRRVPGTGAALAAQGIATISTDQVLHGPRNPTGEEQTDFFNFANPYAMRDNALQGTADAFAQLRLAQGMQFPEPGGAGRTIKFDSTKVYFFGHSQGGLTGPGFVAFEPSLSGAVFSGTGGLLYLGLLYKTKPFDISMLLATFLRDNPVDEDNPSLAMLQMWVERADGGNYAPMFVRRPVGTPRNIFQTEGFVDTYTPNPSIQAFAVAVGGDLVQLADTADIAGLALRGRSVKAAPISANVDGATAALGQYKQRTGSDGHFVVFDIAAAKRQAASFLGTLAATGTATVVP